MLQEERNNVRKLMASFVWTNISKLSFEVSPGNAAVACRHCVKPLLYSYRKWVLLTTRRFYP